MRHLQSNGTCTVYGQVIVDATHWQLYRDISGGLQRKYRRSGNRNGWSGRRDRRLGRFSSQLELTGNPYEKHKEGFACGFTLLEVLIGMVVFALGMMALAQLQGNLSKSSADANARSVAVNLAEETIEEARTFTQVTASAGVSAFNNIVNKTETVTRGGINYTVTHVVTDYWYNPATGTFGAKPSGSKAVNRRHEKTTADRFLGP